LSSIKLAKDIFDTQNSRHRVVLIVFNFRRATWQLFRWR